MINSIVGKRIQQRRKVLEISSVQMAIKLGVSEHYYLKLESGYINITVDELIIISLILRALPQTLLSKISHHSLTNEGEVLEKHYH